VWVNEVLNEKVDSFIPSLFRDYNASQIVGLSGRNEFSGIEENAPLLVGIELMIKWNLHRIPVIDSEGNLISIISQSHIIKFIHDHMYLLKKTKNKSIRHLNIGTPNVVTVPDSFSLIQAFKVLNEKKLSGVGVVDNGGNLVGNLSASDIKRTFGYDADFLRRLFSPINLILNSLSPTQTAKCNVITVNEDDTFETLIQTLVTHHIHRVYVINNHQVEQQPNVGLKHISIITLTDILRHLFQE